MKHKNLTCKSTTKKWKKNLKIKTNCFALIFSYFFSFFKNNYFYFRNVYLFIFFQTFFFPSSLCVNQFYFIISFRSGMFSNVPSTVSTRK